MKVSTCKKMRQKLIIIILLLLFFQCIPTTQTYAIESSVLVEPITSLFANLGDGIMEIMQKTFLGIQTSGAWIEIDSGFWERLLAIAMVIVIAVIAVISVVFSGGTTLAVIGAVFGYVVRTTIGVTVVYFSMKVLHIGEERNIFT